MGDIPQDIAQHMPQEWQRLVHFNVFTGANKPSETITLTRIVDANGVEEFTVIARIYSNPDEYTQSWSFKGEDAGVRAMNKCLAYTGWGTLLDQSYD